MSEEPIPAMPRKKGGSCLLKGVIGLLALGLIFGGLWWWFNRPIQPVVLTPQEKAVVEAKVDSIQAPVEPKYEKGSKEIILTERELNGLLNDNTALGKSVSLELATNAVHARMETNLDPGLPFVGGRRLKARARFVVSQIPGQASLVLDDVTVWGVSLPNDWLAGMKGKDMLGDILGGEHGGRIPGVKQFKVEPGRLIIRLAE